MAGARTASREKINASATNARTSGRTSDARAKRPRKLKVIKLGVKPSTRNSVLSSKITLRDIREPSTDNIDDEIEWIFRCFDLGEKDDYIAKEIFKELVKRSESGVRSAEICTRCNVTQGAVVYHLNNLIQSGFAVKQGRYYYLRKQRLDETIDELENEMLRRFERIKRIAYLIEKKLMRL